MTGEEALAGLLGEGIAEGFFAGAAAAVADERGILAESAAGWARVEPEKDRLAASPETLWDLASLTKPLAGTALAQKLAEGGSLRLDDPLARFHDLYKRTKFEGVTLRRLLAHTAGLPAWFPCYVRGEGRTAYRRTLADFDLLERPGSKAVYSCLGFLLLSDAVEEAARESLDRLFSAEVAGPLGLAGDLGFSLDPAACARAAGGERDDATERNLVADLGLSYAGFRSGVVNGEANDGNAAHRAGGVSLNAGLFGTARAVAEAGRAWLLRDARLLREGSIAEAVAPADGGRGLGWELAPEAPAAGEALSASSFGHTGFTGASLFVDPVARRVYVLLANRLHPDARSVDMNAFRRRFHQRAARL